MHTPRDATSRPSMPNRPAYGTPACSHMSSACSRTCVQAEPSSLWHTNLEDGPHIYHYTFGLEYTLDGMPVIGGVGVRRTCRTGLQPRASRPQAAVPLTPSSLSPWAGLVP